MEFPEVAPFDASDDEGAAGRALRRRLAELGIESPFIVSSRHGSALARELEGKHAETPAPATLDQDLAAHLGHEAHRSGSDAIVAIGGGRILDVAKLAAARAGLTVVVAPTQLSHDGICSPVAVVPGDDGKSESLGAIAPRLVFLSIPTLMKAPAASARAGVGDLVANAFALRDWALAAEHGLEDIDQRAWDLSAQSYAEVEPYLDDPPTEGDPAFVTLLAGALVTSGTAMIVAGTSRPASGAEHEISHAIDHELGGRAMHGAQVAFGCLFSAALFDEDVASLSAALRRLGLPVLPQDLGLSDDDTARLLLKAPDTRPGRFTVLESADLNEAGAAQLVRRVRDAAS